MDKRSAIIGAKINVGGGADDHSYRYSVPVATVQVVSKGSYITTLLPNLEEVVSSVKEFYEYIEVKYVLKFLGNTLSVGAEMNKGGIPKLKGQFQSQEINQALVKYFDLFVLCPKCFGPETRGVSNGKGTTIYVQCKACGGGWPVTSEAKNHKFYSNAVKMCKKSDKLFNKLAQEYKTNTQSSDSKKKGSAKKKQRRLKKLTAREYLHEMKPTPTEFIDFLETKNKKPEQRMVSGFSALFWEANTMKKQIKSMEKHLDHFKALVEKFGTAGTDFILGALVYLAAPKPRTLKPLFSTAVSFDLFIAEDLERWVVKPFAKKLREVGQGSLPNEATLKDCVLEAQEVIDYLNLSDSSSISDVSDTQE